MLWMSVYAASAIVTAVAVFLFAEWTREPGIPAPECPGRCALIAGLIWPLLIVGVAQWMLIAAAQSWLRTSGRQSAAPEGALQQTS